MHHPDLPHTQSSHQSTSSQSQQSVAQQERKLTRVLSVISYPAPTTAWYPPYQWSVYAWYAPQHLLGILHRCRRLFLVTSINTEEMVNLVDKWKGRNHSARRFTSLSFKFCLQCLSLVYPDHFPFLLDSINYDMLVFSLFIALPHYSLTHTVSMNRIVLLGFFLFLCFKNADFLFDSILITYGMSSPSYYILLGIWLPAVTH